MCFLQDMYCKGWGDDNQIEIQLFAGDIEGALAGAFVHFSEAKIFSNFS